MRRSALGRGGALHRGTELQRTPMARRTAPLRTPQRPRLAAQPLGAPVCQAHAHGAPGRCWGGLHRHHRLPRGRGGPDTAGNLVWLCAGHHGWVHGHPLDSRRLGLLE